MRIVLIAALTAVCALAWADDSAGKKAFVDVARVLQSPRCANCHPAGDAPTQTDRLTQHKMNISRKSVAAGLACNACHQLKNSDEIGIAGGPPGAAGWSLPPADMPMVFQGKTVTELCEQLKDPARNGHRTLDQLVEHVEKEPLVLWGWKPGGKRTLPPMSHDAFVAAVKTWVASGGPCP